MKIWNVAVWSFALSIVSVVAGCSADTSGAEEPTESTAAELSRGAGNVNTGSANAGKPCIVGFPGATGTFASDSATVSWDGTGCYVDKGASTCLSHEGDSLHYYEFYTRTPATAPGWTYKMDFYSGTTSSGAYIEVYRDGDPTKMDVVLYGQQHGAWVPNVTQPVALSKNCFNGQ